MPELRCATALACEDFDMPADSLANWNAAIAPRAASDNNVISILTPIGEGLFTEGFTANRMSAALRSIGTDNRVRVQINSPGGRIDEGTAIYNMLRQHKGEVDVEILGLAGSIASVIAMAGDSIKIAKAGFVFIHNGQAAARGNRHVMAAAIADLREFDNMMAQVYADRTGQTTREVERLMDGKLDGTLMGSTVAIEKGFADALLPADAVTVSDKRSAIRSDIAATRRLEALATSPEQVSRSEVIRLLKEIKGDKRDAIATGKRDAADDAMRDAGVSYDLLKALSAIDIH